MKSEVQDKLAIQEIADISKRLEELKENLRFYGDSYSCYVDGDGNAVLSDKNGNLVRYNREALVGVQKFIQNILSSTVVDTKVMYAPKTKNKIWNSSTIQYCAALSIAMIAAILTMHYITQPQPDFRKRLLEQEISTSKLDIRLSRLERDLYR